MAELSNTPRRTTRWCVRGILFCTLVVLSLPPALTFAAGAATEPLVSVPLHSADALERQISFWQQRAALDPDDSLARTRLGTDYLLRARLGGDFQDYLRAEQVLSDAAVTDPASYDIQVALAFALAAQHRFAEAADHAVNARDLYPARPEAWAALGDALFDSGDLVAGEQAYKHLLAMGESTFALTRIANVQAVRGDRAAAQATLERAVALGEQRGVAATERARLLTRIGEMYFNAGDMVPAEAWYRRALALWPDGWLPLEHLAELLRDTGRVEASIAAYERVLMEVQAPDLLVAAAAAYAAAGDGAKQRRLLDAAEQGFRSGVEAGDPGHLRALAHFLADVRGQPEQGLEYALADLAYRQDAGAWDTLLQVATQAHRPELARKAAQHLLAAADAQPDMRARAQLAVAGKG